jgi:RNA polymerase sigma-70 factor, ECF subfamily
VTPGLDHLFDAHHLVVYRYLLRMTGHRDEAEDLTQEVFLRAVRGIGQYEARGLDRAWLFRIAHNLLVDRQRRNRRAPQIAAGVAPDTLSRDSSDAFSAMVLDEAMARLSELDREAFVLREVNGLSYAEIADITETTSDAVAARLYRARGVLRALLRGRPVSCPARTEHAK